MRRLVGVILTASVVLLAASGALADNLYGAGTYGACQYGSCSLTLTSSGNVSLNITPTASGACTIASDSVSVLTDNSAGYTLTLGDSASNASLTNGASSLAPSAGSQASPATLAMNQWGYRVDNVGGFGAGPTAAASNAAIGAAKFAPVPATASPDTLKTTATTASNDTTTVWYGIAVDSTAASGTYTNNVTYTATAN